MEHFRQTIKNCVSSPGKYLYTAFRIFHLGAVDKLTIIFVRSEQRSTDQSDLQFA